ncbi:MAG: acyltransferase [Actinobacteria bacterium]|nr:acyltransferase [Actinomycetota bacterium]
MVREKLHKDITSEDTSNVSKYRGLYLGGEMNFWGVLNFEIITMLFCNMPGAMGLFLRKVFYRSLFKKAGRNVIFGRGVTIRHPLKISMGNNVVVEDNCVLDAKGDNSGGLEIGNNVIISRNVVLSSKNGYIKIGDNTVIGINSVVHSVGKSSVVVGSDVLISAYVYLIGGGTYHYERSDIPIREQGLDLKGGIVIEDNVWLGASVNVIDGVTIKKGSIVGACSLVAKDIIEENSVVLGMPARVIKKRF